VVPASKRSVPELGIVVRSRADGHPIAGARVMLLRRDDATLAGVTARDGRLAVPVRLASAWTRVGAAMPGYGARDEPLPEALASGAELSIELPPAASIAGRVIDWARNPVPGGVRVAAWRDEHWPSLDRIAAALRAADPDLMQAIAVTGDDGAFRIDDLCAGERYTVVAAGRGFVSASPVAVAAMHRDCAIVEVRVTGLYGAFLRVLAADGVPVATEGGETRSPLETSFSLRDDDARDLVDTGLAVLAGLAPADVRRSFEANGLALQTKDARDGRVGPVKFTVSAPGHSLVSERFDLDRSSPRQR
jgi:hypothetical protein